MAESKGATHAKRAACELRRRIVNGEMPGGTRLYEVSLAADLDISRTPVREAMSRLAEEGLLERAPGGGFVVRSFTLRDVFDAIELRGVLEGTAARLAAERGVSEEHLKKIKSITDEIETCFSPFGGPFEFERYSTLNGAFHEELAGLCGSVILMRELERVKSLPFASPSAFVPRGNGGASSHSSLVIAQDQHRALIDAVAHREGARAESIAREHARNARRNLEANRASGDETGQTLPGMGLVVE